VTRTQACQVLGVAAKSLYLWERAGKIPAPRRDRRGWRQYSEADLRAIRSFLGPGGDVGPGGDEARPAGARRGRASLEGLSARNQLRGTVVAVRGDGVLCEVVMRLGDGQQITSVITRRSADRIGLRRGAPVVAVIKSTEVMLFR
jgi:molybdopterin-binding protein